MIPLIDDRLLLLRLPLDFHQGLALFQTGAPVPRHLLQLRQRG